METARQLLNRRGKRSLSLAKAPLPAKNVGKWLDSQSLPQLVDPNGDRDDGFKDQENTSPEAKVDSQDCMSPVSQSGSDSISVHTSPSTTSFTNPASHTRFKSLAEQIADDDRRERAKEQLRRIIEAEEARIAENDSSEGDEELEVGEGTTEDSKNHSLPNALRLTWEPQSERWDVDDLLLAPGNSVDEGPPDYKTATSSHRSSLVMSEALRKSVENSSTLTIVLADEKDPDRSTTPISQEKSVHLEQSADFKDDREQAASSPLPQVEEDARPHEDSGVVRENRHQATSTPSDSSTSQTLSNEKTALPDPSVQSQIRHESIDSSPSVSAPSKDPVQPAAVEDTLFHDLNRLRMSSSIRQRSHTQLHRPSSSTSRSSVDISQRSMPHTAIPSFRPSPAPVFATVNPPQATPPGPAYKEILTPPIPENVVELSTSKSVQYRVRPPKVHEKYRRNRQHLDQAAYNTLPHEPYPLLPPEPRFEAHPSEEDLRHLQHTRSPINPVTEAPVPKSKPHRPISIQPDIDPRTGFPWRNQGH